MIGIIIFMNITFGVIHVNWKHFVGFVFSIMELLLINLFYSVDGADTLTVNWNLISFKWFAILIARFSKDVFTFYFLESWLN